MSPILKFKIFMNIKNIIIINQFHFVMNSYIFLEVLTSTLCTSSLFLEFTCTVFSVKFVFNLTSTSRPDCWSKPENLESAWRETTVSCIFLYNLFFVWHGFLASSVINSWGVLLSRKIINKLACINASFY